MVPGLWSTERHTDYLAGGIRIKSAVGRDCDGQLRPATGSPLPATLAGAVWDHTSLTRPICRLADAWGCPSACARTTQSLAALQREARTPVKAPQRDSRRSNPRSCGHEHAPLTCCRLS
jgi:hypothetical protein